MSQSLSLKSLFSGENSMGAGLIFFQKKSQKTPQNKIRLAEKLMKEYFDEQKQLKKS